MIDTATPRTIHARTLFARLGPTYDRMGAILSLGQDPRWRRFLVSRVPMGTGTVLDVATGTGLVAGELVRSGRASSVIGLDPSEPMLLEGHRRREGVTFVLGRAEALPFPGGRFDALTVTYLLRYVDDPGETLRELARVVRPGATVASLEFGVPPNRVWRVCWWLYTRLAMPAIGRLASRDWYEAGRFLGPSIEDLWRRFPLAEQQRLWREAGLGPMRWRRMSLGGGIVCWAVRER